MNKRLCVDESSDKLIEIILSLIIPIGIHWGHENGRKFRGFIKRIIEKTSRVNLRVANTYGLK